MRSIPFLFAFLAASLSFAEPSSSPQGVKVGNLWSDKPLANLGDSFFFSAFIENNGPADLDGVTVDLQCPANLSFTDPQHRVLGKLAAGAFERVDWKLAAKATGQAILNVTASAANNSVKSADYKILVVDPADHLTRQQLCTDADGFWHILDKPTTLQTGNTVALTAIRHKTASQIGHNTYGMCIQLPRSKVYEDPFNVAHLIDDDPQTSWSSMQRPNPYPGDPPWVQIDLGAVHTIKQINLIPHWNNGEFPLGFTIQTGTDGKDWQTALIEKNYQLDKSGPKRGDKIAQQFPLQSPATARFIHIDFQRLPPSNGYFAEVVSGYKARLSGIEVIDDQDKNVALSNLGATIQASETFTGWQNTNTEVAQAFNRFFDIGLKWVRIGQWGDQTEWAAVEREKGKFQMDPATDAAIRKLAENHVDILYGLNYGNSLYERPDKPYIDIGPIWHEGSPFYLNAGPRTDAGREAFVRYVDFVVNKYKDQVKYWELWNEENGWYPGFEPELYGKLLFAVAKHLKEIDPKATMVYGGTAAPAPITTEISLRGGAAPYVDVYAFHPYGIDKPEGGMGTMEQYQGKNLSQSPQQTGWKTLEDIVAGVKKPFAAHGKPDIKIWLDEWGTNITGLDYAYNPHIGEFGCAKWMTRFYIYSGWLDLPAAWWAFYTDNKSQDWGIIDPKDFSMRPMSYAAQNVCSLVSDVHPLHDLDIQYTGNAPQPKTIAFQADADRHLMVLIWSADSSNDDVHNYSGKLSFPFSQQPKTVMLTDVYWGLSQPAVWKYENGRVILDQLIVHDYPLTVSCQ